MPDNSLPNRFEEALVQVASDRSNPQYAKYFDSDGMLNFMRLAGEYPPPEVINWGNLLFDFSSIDSLVNGVVDFSRMRVSRPDVGPYSPLGITIRNLNFAKLNWTNSEFKSITFEVGDQSKLSNVSFAGSVFSGFIVFPDLYNIDFNNVRGEETDVRVSSTSNCNWQDVSIDRLTILGTVEKCQFDNSQFKLLTIGSFATSSIFDSSKLRQSTFVNMVATNGLRLIRVVAYNCDFSYAVINQLDLLDSIVHDVSFSNGAVEIFQLYQSIIQSCNFDGCIFRQFNPRFCAISDSSFVDTAIQYGYTTGDDSGDLVLGQETPGFDTCNFTRTLFYRFKMSVRVERCDFTEAQLLYCEFMKREITDCSFRRALFVETNPFSFMSKSNNYTGAVFQRPRDPLTGISEMDDLRGVSWQAYKISKFRMTAPRLEGLDIRGAQVDDFQLNISDEKQNRSEPVTACNLRHELTRQGVLMDAKTHLPEGSGFTCYSDLIKATIIAGPIGTFVLILFFACLFIVNYRRPSVRERREKRRFQNRLNKKMKYLEKFIKNLDNQRFQAIIKYQESFIESRQKQKQFDVIFEIITYHDFLLLAKFPPITIKLLSSPRFLQLRKQPLEKLFKLVLFNTRVRAGLSSLGRASLGFWVPSGLPTPQQQVVQEAQPLNGKEEESDEENSDNDNEMVPLLRV